MVEGTTPYQKVVLSHELLTLINCNSEEWQNDQPRPGAIKSTSLSGECILVL